MRGLDTNVKRIRHKVFKEIARVGFESEPDTLVADIEAIPYHIVQERATYREVFTGKSGCQREIRLDGYVPSPGKCGCTYYSRPGSKQY